MSSVQVDSQRATEIPGVGIVDMKLEVVFGAGLRRRPGQALLPDAGIPDGHRLRRRRGLPGGAADATGLGGLDHHRQWITSAVPGSVEGLQLTVFDIEAARAELVGRGVDVSDVFHDVGGVFHHAGTEGRAAGPDSDRADYGSFVSFSDPDGNGWLLQEVKPRAPGR